MEKMDDKILSMVHSLFSGKSENLGNKYPDFCDYIRAISEKSRVFREIFPFSRKTFPTIQVAMNSKTHTAEF